MLPSLTLAALTHPPTQVLTEDISPALDKLRGEKAAYMEWQNAQAGLERLRRFCVAHRYSEAERCARAAGRGRGR